jgi:hypothetical protein
VWDLRVRCDGREFPLALPDEVPGGAWSTSDRALALVADAAGAAAIVDQVRAPVRRAPATRPAGSRTSSP